IVAWLDGATDEEDIGIWGFKKISYAFTDLNTWLLNGGPLEFEDEDEDGKLVKNKKKGKGKAKEMEKEKGKEKRKERKMEMEMEMVKGKGKERVNRKKNTGKKAQ
ncbi:hypothetical protein L208DRAFT_1409899, partial [Tricholoma matsutake]